MCIHITKPVGEPGIATNNTLPSVICVNHIDAKAVEQAFVACIRFCDA
jgi:hypothetical protein